MELSPLLICLLNREDKVKSIRTSPTEKCHALDLFTWILISFIFIPSIIPSLDDKNISFLEQSSWNDSLNGEETKSWAPLKVNKQRNKPEQNKKKMIRGNFWCLIHMNHWKMKEGNM